MLWDVVRVLINGLSISSIWKRKRNCVLECGLNTVERQKDALKKDGWFCRGAATSNNIRYNYVFVKCNQWFTIILSKVFRLWEAFKPNTHTHFANYLMTARFAAEFDTKMFKCILPFKWFNKLK